MKKYSPISNYSPRPPKSLFEKIMRRIREERKLLALKRKLIFLSIVFVGSIAALIPTFRMTQAGFVESGFIEFFSLLFSDANIIAAYWKNFALSLLETLPVTNLIMLLTVMLLFLESLKLLINNAKNIVNSTHLIKMNN